MVLKRAFVNFGMLCSMAFIVACSGEASTENSVENDAVASNGETPDINAAAIYQVQCTQCHGADGKLGLAGAKDLTASVLSTDEKIAVVTDGRGAMMPYKSLLSADEIKAVVTYLEEKLSEN